MSATLLALETSTDACSVALLHNQTFKEIFQIMPREHSQYIMIMIENLLQECGVHKSQLDAIIFGQGPGTFTGLRIATATAQGLAFALDCPLIPVSSLKTLAHQAVRLHKATHMIAALDARMGQIYWASYTHQSEKNLQRLSEESLSNPMNVTSASPSLPWFGIGSGWMYKESIPINTIMHDAHAHPHAQDALSLGLSSYEKKQWISPEKAHPHYLRNNIAEKKISCS